MKKNTLYPNIRPRLKSIGKADIFEEGVTFKLFLNHKKFIHKYLYSQIKGRNTNGQTDAGNSYIDVCVKNLIYRFLTIQKFMYA